MISLPLPLQVITSYTQFSQGQSWAIAGEAGVGKSWLSAKIIQSSGASRVYVIDSAFEGNESVKMMLGHSEFAMLSTSDTEEIGNAFSVISKEEDSPIFWVKNVAALTSKFDNDGPANIAQNISALVRQAVRLQNARIVYEVPVRSSMSLRPSYKGAMAGGRGLRYAMSVFIGMTIGTKATNNTVTLEVMKTRNGPIGRSVTMEQSWLRDHIGGKDGRDQTANFLGEFDGL